VSGIVIGLFRSVTFGSANAISLLTPALIDRLDAAFGASLAGADRLVGNSTVDATATKLLRIVSVQISLLGSAYCQQD